jgi:uncharacterized protein with PhoU and TrkA domain
VHSDEHDVDIQEVSVPPGSGVVGARLGDVCPAAVIALKAPDGSYAFTPPPDRTLAAGEVLIAVGSAAQLDELASAVARPRS